MIVYVPMLNFLLFSLASLANFNRNMAKTCYKWLILQLSTLSMIFNTTLLPRPCPWPMYYFARYIWSHGRILPYIILHIKLPKIPYTTMFIFERQKDLPYNPNLAHMDVRVFLVQMIEKAFEACESCKCSFLLRWLYAGCRRRTTVTSLIFCTRH